MYTMYCLKWPSLICLFHFTKRYASISTLFFFLSLSLSIYLFSPYCVSMDVFVLVFSKSLMVNYKNLFWSRNRAKKIYVEDHKDQIDPSILYELLQKNWALSIFYKCTCLTIHIIYKVKKYILNCININKNIFCVLYDKCQYLSIYKDYCLDLTLYKFEITF